MNMERPYMASAVIDDKIYVIGGMDHTGKANRVEYFNEEENEWFVHS
jgi:hypothetical protein